MLRTRFSSVIAAIAALGAMALAGTPASADIIVIGSCNGCGVAGPYATVTLTQIGSGVSVQIQATAAFSLKTADGSDIFFNPTVPLTANSFEDTVGNVGTISSNGPTMDALSFGFSTSQNVDGLGTFAVDLTGIGTGQVGNVQSVASFDFTVLGVTVAELEGTNSPEGNSFGAHICDAPGTGCSQTTFFGGTTTTTSGPPLVPEPGTLALLGSALAALGLFRRRKSV